MAFEWFRNWFDKKDSKEEGEDEVEEDPGKGQMEIGNELRSYISKKFENSGVEVNTDARGEGTYQITVRDGNTILLKVSINFRSKKLVASGNGEDIMLPHNSQDEFIGKVESITDEIATSKKAA
ncbi:hypothetical protein CL617_03045 [archaeon]|nr:hypothetical protein [archaeon]|tara:strand:- start:17779 stop:18150 length:372 start_codon:yes stop_codon:yes gene_type:complete